MSTGPPFSSVAGPSYLPSLEAIGAELGLSLKEIEGVLEGVVLAIERVPEEFPALPGSTIRVARRVPTEVTPPLNVVFRFHGADADVPLTLLYVEFG